MRCPSLETNHLRVSHNWYAASARSAPCSAIVVVARTSRSPLSDSATENGSITHSLAHDPVAGTLGTSSDAVARDERAGGRDLGGHRPGAAHGAITEIRGGEEPPSRTDEGPHADCRSRRRARPLRSRRCGRTSTRGAGASLGHRRSEHRRRGRPGRPPQRRRTRSCRATIEHDRAPSIMRDTTSAWCRTLDTWLPPLRQRHRIPTR